MATEIYHFTCQHRAHKILETGLLQPNPQPVLGDMELSWFTHVPGASSRALGLTSHTLTCDRRERLFRVTDPAAVFRWNEVRAVMPRQGVLMLEAAPGAMPAFWWVAQGPVTVELISAG